MREFVVYSWELLFTADCRTMFGCSSWLLPMDALSSNSCMATEFPILREYAQCTESDQSCVESWVTHFFEVYS